MPEYLHYTTFKVISEILLVSENKGVMEILQKISSEVLLKIHDFTGNSMVKVVPLPSVEETVTSPP